MAVPVVAGIGKVTGAAFTVELADVGGTVEVRVPRNGPLAGAVVSVVDSAGDVKLWDGNVALNVNSVTLDDSGAGTPWAQDDVVSVVAF